MKNIMKTNKLIIITNVVMALSMFVALAAMVIYGMEIGIDLIFATLAAAVFIYLYLYTCSLDIADKFYTLITEHGIDTNKI